ncbi:hypothetical protein [Nocardia asteroides]|uniref:hypothetical protein n=1 Tax=Nocardia asteroides TaxID=1824 RepID=UPI001E36BDC7|nr:hypothetical protein [Nocardia asteroides]UGT52400.1 hypothetical protein LTT85_16785 [Nocardia asteroides]
MFRTSRIAAGVATTALVVAGVGVGLGSGVAAADTGCSVSSHAQKKDASTVGVTHVYDKIASAEQIGVGTSVTYKVIVGTTGIGNPYVNTITDFPPVGFGAPTKTTITAYHAIGGQVTEDVTAEPNAGGWKVTSTGWFVNSGNPVTLTITYPVPDSVKTGQQVTSGGVGVAGTVGVSNEMPGLTACFTARGANAGETVIGSLGDNGLGSSDGQLSSTGSLSDILSDVLGNLIGS